MIQIPVDENCSLHKNRTAGGGRPFRPPPGGVVLVEVFEFLYDVRQVRLGGFVDVVVLEVFDLFPAVLAPGDLLLVPAGGFGTRVVSNFLVPQGPTDDHVRLGVFILKSLWQWMDYEVFVVV